MLSSRYAPVVALAVLGVVLVGVLGWFFAVKPQIDAAADLLSREDAVEANIAQIEASSERIDQFAALLDADTGVEETTAVHAPSQLDLVAFRDRLAAALVSSSSELVNLENGSTVAVDGWQIPPNLLVSNQVAALFQDGPVGETAGASTPQASPSPGTDGATGPAASAGGWTPVVSPITAEGPVTEAIKLIPFTISIAGSPVEAFAFFEAMALEADPVFQVYEVSQEARQSDGAPINGVSDPRDGDVITTVVGALYALDPQPVFDEGGELPTVSPRGDGFIETPAAGPQPGAN